MTYSGRASTTWLGGCLANQAPRSFFFCSVLGGYLEPSMSDTDIHVRRKGQRLLLGYTYHSMGQASPLSLCRLVC